jgi:trans-aconitate methyltransferase
MTASVNLFGKMQSSNQIHWDKIYETKAADQYSWTQKFPKTSLDFIHSFNLNKTAKIIDVGGGDGKLVDCLLLEGFENITVLDISAKALEKTKNRLGINAERVKWIVEDITHFQPSVNYDLWHDRATFHFLTEKRQIKRYLDIVKQCLTGYLIIGTFSTQGPEKCSGLNIRQYDETTLAAELESGFDKIRCITEDHITPFNTLQNFLFCSFKRNFTAT